MKLAQITTQRLRSVLAASAALWLGACALGADYQRPALDVPGVFRGETIAGDGPTLADLAWWDVYRDPTLQQLIKTALEHNYDVQIAAARVEEYRALASIGGFGQFPSASIGGSSTRSRISTVGPTPLPGSTSAVRDTYQADLNLSYEIDLWRRLSSLSAAARADFLKTEFARDTTRIGLVADVATAYFNLLALDQLLTVTERTIATRQKFLDLTQAQFRRGTVSGLDVNRAEANLASAQVNMPDLKRQTAQAENLLQRLLGANPAAVERPAVGEGAFAAVPPEVPAGLPSTLIDRRPDIRAAESALIGANARLKAQRALLLPTFTLTGGYGSQSGALATFLETPAKTWALGLGLLLPLIDSSRNFYQVDAAEARELQAALEYQQTVQQAFGEVSDALIARQYYREVLQTQETQTTALRAAAERVLKRYQVGYSSYFEVIDADQSLYSAELQRIQSYRDSLTSVVQLYKALGGGWQAAALETMPPEGPSAGTEPAQP